MPMLQPCMKVFFLALIQTDQLNSTVAATSKNHRRNCSSEFCNSATDKTENISHSNVLAGYATSFLNVVIWLAYFSNALLFFQRHSDSADYLLTGLSKTSVKPLFKTHAASLQLVYSITDKRLHSPSPCLLL